MCKVLIKKKVSSALPEASRACIQATTWFGSDRVTHVIYMHYATLPEWVSFASGRVEQKCTILINFDISTKKEITPEHSATG